MARRVLNQLGVGGELDCIENVCCDCWTEGCGLDGCYGCLADGLEVINPAMEYVADCIWVCGSPIAFPIVFLFSPGPETTPPGGGWQMPMIQTPCRKPIQCCLYSICAPCGQWHLRRQLLKGDMSKYKLWQGYHDGPHCCARRCPGAPITIQSGTYGEQNCPNAFLCAEVWCLGCAWSVCCSFDVNRRMMKVERNLGNDPTEERVDRCISYFSSIMHQLFALSCCVCCASCLIGCCAPGSEGAQECSQQGGRASRSCRSCARTLWRGIWSIKVIAMGCMSAQMDHEMKEGQPLASPPVKQRMDRGGDFNGDNDDGDDDDEDKWWKKPNHQ